MKLLPYALPILTALLLIVFSFFLPNLKHCALPAFGPEGKRDSRLTRADALPILLITLVYAATAFFRLGGTAAPQTFVPMEGQTAEFTLPEGAQPRAILLYPGVGQGSYELSWSEDGEVWEPASVFEQGHIEVLKWASLQPEPTLRPRYLRLACTAGSPWMGELVFVDGDGAPIPAECSLPALCDEPDTAREDSHFLYSSYFDEIYHARTAWEHLHGVWPYEISHPPLGKEILSLGIALFGMTPFGWRFSGAFFGTLMLPVLYVFLKKLFGGRAVPSLGTILFATDFMHYVQTRIATIDTYSVFFILLMYFFLYLWLTEEKPWALALCGLSFGLGAAAKWTSIYAGAGLGLLWAAHWIRQAILAKKARGPHPPVFPRFVKNSLFCIVFFILVPLTVYYFAYLPYGTAKGVGPFSRDYLQLVLDNQEFMFTYHSKSVLGSTHPYSSVWYQWLLNIRPILYVLEYPTPETKISIAAFLNPVLCWGGLLSLFVLGYLALWRRDRTAAFLLVGYLSQILPWVAVERLTFAYHYFPSALFLVLSLSYLLSLVRENRPDWKLPALLLTGGSAALFALFFPSLNGLEISRELGSALMKWLPTWPL